MDNQQGPTVQHRELCSTLCGWEGSSGENGHMCMYGWVPLLFTSHTPVQNIKVKKKFPEIHFWKKKCTLMNKWLCHFSHLFSSLFWRWNPITFYLHSIAGHNGNSLPLSLTCEPSPHELSSSLKTAQVIMHPSSLTYTWESNSTNGIHVSITGISKLLL